MHPLCLLLTFLLAAPSSAQSWQSSLGATAPPADPLATALTPLGITCTGNLSFGCLIPNGGGTVTLRPQGNQRRTTGSITVMSTPPARCAQFYVTGEKNARYSVMLPAAAALTRDGGAETMTASDFVVKSENSNKIHGNGWDRVTVGATLYVGSSQRMGLYTGLWYLTVAYE